MRAGATVAAALVELLFLAPARPFEAGPLPDDTIDGHVPRIPLERPVSAPQPDVVIRDPPPLPYLSPAPPPGQVERPRAAHGDTAWPPWPPPTPPRAPPSPPISYRDGPFHRAAAADDAESIKRLAAGAGINQPGARGETALLRAVAVGATAAVRALLKHGADGDVASTSGERPIDTAVRDGRAGIVRLLVHHGVELRQRHPADGLAPLHRACVAGATADTPPATVGHVSIVSTLLLAGVPWNEPDRDGRTPIEIVRALLPGTLGRKERLALLRAYEDENGESEAPVHDELRLR